MNVWLSERQALGAQHKLRGADSVFLASAALFAAGDNVFSADDFSKRDDAIGYQFRCSTRSVEWLTTHGIRIFSAGSFTSRQLRPSRYEDDLSPIATSSGNFHDLAVLRNSAGESVWTIDEPRCSCSRSSVTNSAADISTSGSAANALKRPSYSGKSLTVHR
jgi:hypothetical protein